MASVRSIYARVWGAVSASPAMLSSPWSDFVFALVVGLAVMPVAGWALPAGWLAAMTALIAAGALAPRTVGAVLAPWLETVGYTLVAFYLVLTYTGSAQTLGVTLYGVTLFKILLRDYARPRRLLLSLAAPVASMLAAQAYAAVLRVAWGRPWEILTLLASPYVVFLVLRALHHGLTAKQALESELAASEQKLRGLFELAPLGIVLTDMRGHLLQCNRAFQTLTGYAPHELDGLNYWRLTPAEYAGQEREQLERLRSTGRYGPYETEYVRKDGARAPVRLDGVLVEAASGEKLIWSIVEDIAEQRRARAALIAAHAEAEAAARTKSEFLANMSHEIRTPLTAVVGFADVLTAMDDLPGPARRYASLISTSADALLSVVNDVLDFSKLEAGRIELDPQPFDPTLFLRETTELVRERAARKGLDLSLEIGGELPARVVGDSARLRQVLLNLVSNAVKFTETGGVTVAADYEPAGARLRVRVEDTGAGIAPDKVRALFQRFSQVDASSTRQHGGSGLGLAISKAIVELMGGRIGVESQPGVGSTFWFEIEAPTTQAVCAAPEPTAAPGHALGALSILLVDDVAVNRELVQVMLAPFGPRLVEAASGAEAVSRAMGDRFDLILMDLQMPGMDGLSAARAIRAGGGPNAGAPILALSANVLPAEVAACREAGMNDHIAKPIRPAELLTKIALWTCEAEAA